jgi:hypothetical protein
METIPVAVSHAGFCAQLSPLGRYVRKRGALNFESLNDQAIQLEVAIADPAK